MFNKAPMVMMAGAKCVYVPLRPNKTDAELTTSHDWTWDAKQLEGAFNSKTKMIVKMKCFCCSLLNL
jgi:aspartate/methionine/tyrosine aminotransferase